MIMMKIISIARSFNHALIFDLIKIKIELSKAEQEMKTIVDIDLLTMNL